MINIANRALLNFSCMETHRDLNLGIEHGNLALQLKGYRLCIIDQFINEAKGLNVEVYIC